MEGIELPDWSPAIQYKISFMEPVVGRILGTGDQMTFDKGNLILYHKREIKIAYRACHHSSLDNSPWNASMNSLLRPNSDCHNGKGQLANLCLGPHIPLCFGISHVNILDLLTFHRCCFSMQEPWWPKICHLHQNLKLCSR